MKPLQKEFKPIAEAKESLSRLVNLRLPWLLLGLLVGTLASLLVSRFEDVLSRNIHLAFFLPLIVYLSDAVGTQTETIYIRNLSQNRVHFFRYLLKELKLGFVLGIILGILVGVFAFVWLGSIATALTVGLSTLINVIISPGMAILISEFLYEERTDPALGTGPVSSVFHGFISVFIYFLVATIIFFRFGS